MSDEQDTSADDKGQESEVQESMEEWEKLEAEVAAGEVAEVNRVPDGEAAPEGDPGGAVAPHGEPAARSVGGRGMAGAATMEQHATEASPVQFPEISGGLGHANLPLDRIYDLKVPVSVELGQSTLSVHEILQLGPGSVVELDNAADSPISMYVHGKRVAMGEIVVVDEYYGVKITSVG